MTDQAPTTPDTVVVPTYEQMVALYNEKTGPMTDCRDRYASWSSVPISVQSAVIAWDAARRSGLNEAPMSERNALSLAGMMAQALTATQRGCDDVVDDEIRHLRQALAARPAATPGGESLRPVVLAFAHLMEAKLRENDWKGGWRKDSPEALLKRLREETDELEQAIGPGSRTDVGMWRGLVANEAADAANFAMMVADVCGGLPKQAAEALAALSRPAPVAREAVAWLVEWTDEAGGEVQTCRRVQMSEKPDAWMTDPRVTPLYTTPEPAAARGGEATGAEAVIRDGQIVISIDVDALPLILSGSIATNSVAGTFKVTDAEVFAKEICRALNDEKEDGTTRVHMMFDSAFNHAIDQGAEGVDDVTEDEFEAEAARLQDEALAALSAKGGS